MAYRFNSGLGGVTCDKCYILFDSDLSYEEYKESYGKNKEDLCWKCKTGFKEEEKKEEKKHG